MSLSLRLIVNVSCRNFLLKYRVEAVDLSQLGVFGEVAPIIAISWIIFNIGSNNSNRGFHLKNDNNNKSDRNDNGRRNPSRRRIALVIAFIILRCYKWYIREEVTRTITLLIGVITLFSKQIFGEYEAYYFIFVYTLFLSEQMKHTLIWFRYWWYWDVPYLDWCWTNDVWDYHLCLEYDHWFTEGMPLPYDIEFYDLDYNNECREVI